MTDTPVYDLRCVTRCYGKVDAVHDATLRIERGEFVAIVGPSGSGKTTLLQLLGGLDRPTSGEVRFEGRDLASLKESELTQLRLRTIGFVFQQFNLLARTSAAENVELPLMYTDTPAAERRSRALKALHAVGLADRKEHHPSQLSGGQQQRVAIARALVNDPHCILADEPTGNLDSRTSDEIMGLLTRLNDAGKTIIMVTHEDDIAAHAKRIIKMRDGLIIDDGPSARMQALASTNGAAHT